MIKILMAAAVTLLMSSSFARAQVVIQADSAMLQPQIKRDALGFSSCGVRGIVISVAGKNFESYDFSVVANAVAPFGTLKAGKSLTTVERVNKGDLSGTVVTPRPEYFWIAQESSGDALMPLKVFPAENQGFILEIGDLIKTYKVIYAMIHGERMHFVRKRAAIPACVS